MMLSLEGKDLGSGLIGNWCQARFIEKWGQVPFSSESVAPARSANENRTWPRYRPGAPQTRRNAIDYWIFRMVIALASASIES